MAFSKSEIPQCKCREFATDANKFMKFAKFAHSRSKSADLLSDFEKTIFVRVDSCLCPIENSLQGIPRLPIRDRPDSSKESTHFLAGNLIFLTGIESIAVRKFLAGIFCFFTAQTEQHGDADPVFDGFTFRGDWRKFVDAPFT
jgi:hypothetical protein